MSKLVFIKDETGAAIAVAPNGLKVMAHASGLGVSSTVPLPLTQVDADVSILTVIQEFDVDGNALDSYYYTPEYKVLCKMSDLPNTDVFSDEVRAFYVDKLIEKTNPVEEPEEEVLG